MTALRLRRPTLVRAPLLLVALMAAVATVATVSWIAWEPARADSMSLTVAVAAAVLTSAALVAARGCFIEVHDGQLRDVVAWRTRVLLDQRRVRHVRVRAGAWRWFELELDDGTLVTLAGACPAQFTARLLPDWKDRDLADLALLGGGPPQPRD